MFCSRCGSQYEGQPGFCSKCGNALLTVIGNLIEIVGAVLFIVVVRGVTSRQDSRDQRLAASSMVDTVETAPKGRGRGV